MTEDRIDGYIRGELTAAEARELAQKSLDDQDLVDDLTSFALARAAVSTQYSANVIRFPRRTRFVAAAAAAAAVIIVMYVYRATPAGKPSLASSTKHGQPILLARNLHPVGGRPEIFRGAEPDSREPRVIGSILSIEGNIATIDLGSLDGLAKGSELDQDAARLMVTTVFRDHARAQLLSGKLRPTDRIRVPAAVHVGALLEQVDALSYRGDLAAARSIAEKAAAWAQTENVPAGEILERLGSLEYQAGMLSSAEKRFQAAGTAAALNAVGTLRMLRGDFAGAAEPLANALAKSTKTESALSANNLGVLAEMRGDRVKAAGYYADAIRALANSPDAADEERRAVEANLARVRGSY